MGAQTGKAQSREQSPVRDRRAGEDTRERGMGVGVPSQPLFPDRTGQAFPTSSKAERVAGLGFGGEE